MNDIDRETIFKATAWEWDHEADGARKKRALKAAGYRRKGMEKLPFHRLPQGVRGGVIRRLWEVK